MFTSGCLFYASSVAEEGWQITLLVGRFFGGFGHGITFVTIFVQATENSSKDFRRLLVSIIGLTMGFSLFFAANFIINIPMPFYQELDNPKLDDVVINSELMSTGKMATVILIFGFLSVPINYFFSHETVPFLLYHNYREDEAQFTLSKLLGEDRNSAIVQEEFQAIRELCNEDYADFPEGKIFTSIHRSLLSIVLQARITSAQCFLSLCIIYFAKIIMHMINEEYAKLVNDVFTANATTIVNDFQVLVNLVHYYSMVVQVTIVVLFSLGLVSTLIGNYFNIKRGFHFTTFLLGASILLYTLFHLIGVLSGLFKAFAVLFLFVYVYFIYLPVDVVNLTYLTEAFPTSTRVKAIAFVTICENVFNSIYINLEFKHNTVSFEFFLMGLIFTLFGYNLFCTMPNTNGLSLGAAKQAYIQAINSNFWQKYTQPIAKTFVKHN